MNTPRWAVSPLFFAALCLLVTACRAGAAGLEAPGAGQGTPGARQETPVDGQEAPEGDEYEPEVSIEYVYYPIEGATPEERRAALDRLGPLDERGQRYDMLTTWYIRWFYLPWSWGGECKLRGIKAEVSVTFTFPQWDPLPGTPQDEIDRWNLYLSNGQTHEDGHQALAVEGARTIVQALRSLPAETTCKALWETAEETGQRILDEIRQKELAYDRETKHGATQGARYP